MGEYVRLAYVVACLSWAGSCGFPRPAPFGGSDAGDDSGPASICTANQALRCDGTDLVRCNSEGTAEVRETCSLGCNPTQLRCNDTDPSNGLGPYLDVAGGEPDVDLGTAATINTDDGTVVVDGNLVTVRSALVAQISAPTILVFIVRSLVANDVTITGRNAFAVVSNGDIAIRGIFSASAHVTTAGPGGFNDGVCKGGTWGMGLGRAFGGTGGGGFGTAGGRGGSATNINGTSSGGAGGAPTGNAALTPLRGGCDSGIIGGSLSGAGGGAIQVVSRTKLAVVGVVAANGSSAAGGGSGGGILLEAPVVDLSGSVVANGGAGAAGCLLPTPGEDGRLDAAPATGGVTCGSGQGLAGGNGGAGTFTAGNGTSGSAPDDAVVSAGHGGGGVGRIRINTAPGGFRRAGLFSPNPSTGTLATR